MMSSVPRRPIFHVMAKPAGPACNLDCAYCFYTEKHALYPPTHVFRMPDEVLENFVRQYIAAVDAPTVQFSWQGGEPLLMGLDFFRKAVDLGRLHGAGKRVVHAIQTNGTLLDDAWCAFFAEHKFLVGISVDGPPDLHDRLRRDRRNGPTFDRVARGVELLRKHGVEFNTLTTISSANARQPLRVYRFLKELGSVYHQYIPLVERHPDPASDDPRLRLAGPPGAGSQSNAAERVTEWSVDGPSYGRFMTAIFDEWVRNDVGRVFVQLFDEALSSWSIGRSSLCLFSETCGNQLVLEHDGTLYPCDHYVYADRALGNLVERPLAEMARSPKQMRFGADKRDTLPSCCRTCEFLFACNGGCPKHRFLRAPDGEPGLNYLCAGYKAFFGHAAPYLNTMATLLERERPPALIMEILRRGESPEAAASGPARAKVGRNDPCPCGSGRKYKHCCGATKTGREA